jgi:hypothetical protein
MHMALRRGLRVTTPNHGMPNHPTMRPDERQNMTPMRKRRLRER